MSHSETEGAFRSLLSTQMAAFAHELASQYPNHPDLLARAKELALEQIGSFNILKVKGGRSRRTGGPRKASAVPADHERCCARTWGDGVENSRCTRKHVNGTFCTTHAKQAAICCVPCTVDKTNPSKRLGLFMGRYDDWQDGKEGVFPFKDAEGLIRIDWASDDMKAIIAGEIKNGTARRPTKGRGSKNASKRGRKKKNISSAEEKSANELANALGTIDNETKVSTAEVTNDNSGSGNSGSGNSGSGNSGSGNSLLDSIGDSVNLTPNPAYDATEIQKELSSSGESKVKTTTQQLPTFEQADLNGDGKIDKEEFEKLVEKQTQQESSNEATSLMSEMDSLVNSAQQEDKTNDTQEAEEIEIEEREFQGKTYCVDPNTQKIYFLECDEEDPKYGSVIGTWSDEGPKLN